VLWTAATKGAPDLESSRVDSHIKTQRNSRRRSRSKKEPAPVTDGPVLKKEQRDDFPRHFAIAAEIAVVVTMVYTMALYHRK
jgi:hypothetical protein